MKSKVIFLIAFITCLVTNNFTVNAMKFNNQKSVSSSKNGKYKRPISRKKIKNKNKIPSLKKQSTSPNLIKNEFSLEKKAKDNNYLPNFNFNFLISGNKKRLEKRLEQYKKIERMLKNKEILNKLDKFYNQKVKNDEILNQLDKSNDQKVENDEILNQLDEFYDQKVENDEMLNQLNRSEDQKVENDEILNQLNRSEDQKVENDEMLNQLNRSEDQKVKNDEILNQLNRSEDQKVKDDEKELINKNREMTYDMDDDFEDYYILNIDVDEVLKERSEKERKEKEKYEIKMFDNYLNLIQEKINKGDLASAKSDIDKFPYKYNTLLEYMNEDNVKILDSFFNRVDILFEYFNTKMNEKEMSKNDNEKVLNDNNDDKMLNNNLNENK